jgi:iron complex outermembrane receptor protein
VFSRITAAAVAAASLLTGEAFARDLPAQQAQAGRIATYNIPAQPLAQALTALAQQAGLQIVVNNAAVAGKTSTAVNGTMAVEQALQQLLAGTGIGFRFTSANTVSISGGPDAGGALQLDPVQVQGVFPVPSQAVIDNAPPPYAGGQVASGAQLGLLGNRGVMDTPFNQTSYTAKKAQDQQAQTVRDVLVDDPSVRPVAPVGGSAAQSFNVRGFTVSGGEDMTFNGLYGLLPVYAISAELAERVEVLKGPSAMLNGMPPSGAIGGTVNVVPKRAGDDPLTQVTAAYASGAQFGAAVDLGRRLGPDKQFGVRFNGVYRAGQTAVEWNSDKTALAALGLDFRGEHFRLSVDAGYQYQYIAGIVPLALVAANVPVPGAPRASGNFGQPWADAERKDLYGIVRAEFDLTERITAYAAFGLLDSRTLSLSGGNPTVTNIAGTTTQSGSMLSQYRMYQSGEIGVRGRFDTGPIDHAFTVGASMLSREIGAGFVTGAAYTSNLYDPTVVARPNIPTPASNKASLSTLSGIAIADTLSATENRVQLTVGARLQNVTAGNFSTVTGLQTSGYDQSALSPSVAVVVKPFWENVSFYGNYIQGLQQGAIVGATFANAGEVFPPYKSTQFEAGVKVDWGKFTTTLSAFQISQPSIVTNTATNTQQLAGEQRNQGIEFNFFGEPIEGVRLIGGAMFLNAVLTKTQGNLMDGWTAAGAPGVQLNLGGEWDTPFIRGLTLTGRAVYTGAQYVGIGFPRQMVPDWARFDVGARYALDNMSSPTGKPVVLRFTIDNLFDANYWASVTASNVLYIGSPRTFRLALTTDF